MKILLLGSSGMLGNQLYKILRTKFKVYTNGLKKRKFDLSNKKNINLLLKKVPDVVINASGITNIETCEKDKKLVQKVNVGVLSDIFKIKKEKNYKFWFIQFSTDQMYDSNNFKKEFFESQKPKINNNYTKTKLQAEKICKKNKGLILRTNFFGKSTVKKKSFSDWVFKNMLGKNSFYLFNDVYFSPLRIESICKFMKEILIKNFGKTGIYNLGSKKGFSKLKFSILFSKYLKVKNNNYKIAKINKILKIKRSRNMLMNVKKFENDFKISLPDLEKEIKREVYKNYLI